MKSIYHIKNEGGKVLVLFFSRSFIIKGKTFLFYEVSPSKMSTRPLINLRNFFHSFQSGQTPEQAVKKHNFLSPPLHFLKIVDGFPSSFRVFQSLIQQIRQKSWQFIMKYCSHFADKLNYICFTQVLQSSQFILQSYSGCCLVRFCWMTLSFNAPNVVIILLEIHLAICLLNYPSQDISRLIEGNASLSSNRL